MFLYKKRDILAGIITLLMLLGSTSSAAVSTQTDISQPVYECPGEPVANLNGALGDGFSPYTENTMGGRDYSRYFSFQTQVDGDIAININKNDTKQVIDIGTSCGGTQIHNGGRNTTNYSGNFPVSSGTTYYVRIREGNRDNRINFTITFDFTTQIVELTPESTPVPTEPIVTEPAPTEPIITDPVVEEPILTEPAPTEPIITEPTPEPTPEPIPEPVIATCVEGTATIEGQMIAASASAEAAVNGDFNTDTVWNKNAGWTISSGTANVDSTGLGNEWLTQPEILTIGKTYTVTFTVSNYTSGSIGTDSWYPDYTDPGYVSSNGVHTIDFTAAKTSFALMAKGDTILSIDNVSVKESNGAAASIANVEVSYGACTTLTDAYGYYILPNVITSEKAVINFTHQGYVRNSAITQVRADSTNYIEYEIGAYDHQETYNSQNSIVLNMVNNATVSFPAAVYSDETGNIYNGDVVAEVAYLDVTTEKGREAFPGTYNGQNTNGETVLFASYGVIAAELKDANGNSLILSDGDTAILTFPTAIGATADNIPLWYYDYAQGVWIEEGYATRLADGKYEGTVSHPGTWSLSQPIENASGIYTDRILYADGTPVKNLRIHAVGENWISSDLSTDDNGVFEIEVIPGEEFTLKAYHYTDKYSATYNGVISAIASGDIVDDRI